MEHLTTHKKIVCVYHKDCIDGTASAAVLLRKYPHATCYPVSHSAEEMIFSEITRGMNEHTQVFVVDCALGVLRFLETGAKVTVIDHHITVKEDMEKLARAYETLMYIFDNDRSGASLTWSVLFPTEAVTQVISLIEDSDLWKGKYGILTRHVNNYLSIFRNDPACMLAEIQKSIDTLIDRGSAITQSIDKDVERFIDVAPNILTLGQYRIPAFNITTHQSYAGNLLSARENSTVALYTIKGDRVTISFRSKERQSPSSREVAELIGGGGHELSAGASLPLAVFLQSLSFNESSSRA